MAVLTSEPNPPARRFLIWMAGALLLLAGAVAGFTVAVDPFYVFGTRLVSGFNRVKPEAGSHEAIVKKSLLPRVCGNTLLLGNSRIDVGFDPDSAQWPESARPVFSAAAAGSSPGFALEMLTLAERTCPPRLVVLGVDFPDFLLAPDDGAPVPPASPPGWRDRLAELAGAALTLDSATAGVMTVLHQGDPFSPTVTPAGHNPAIENVRIARQQGYNRLFAAKLANYRADLHRLPQPVLTMDRNRALRTVAAVIARARGMQARIVLLIHPYHASYLDLVRQSGRWETFEGWKRALAALVQAEPGAGDAARLLDFSTADVTHEPIPPPGDRVSDTRFYWEAGHYKTPLGDLMIPDIVGRGRSDN